MGSARRCRGEGALWQAAVGRGESVLWQAALGSGERVLWQAAVGRFVGPVTS